MGRGLDGTRSICARAARSDVRESLADITLARRLLQFEPKVSFEEGLRRSIDYYKSEYHKAAGK